MSKTIHEIYKELCAKLPENADLEARIIMEHRAGVSWASLIANPDIRVDLQVLSVIMDDLLQRLNGKPLSRIYGVREFWGLPFKVSEHTLDPRPDSETVIECALKYFKEQKRAPRTILDLGTGTGCLLLSLLYEFKDARGLGVDISPEAIKVAQGNAKSLGLESRADFICGNWTDSITDRFDLVISNPPYIESGVIPNLEKNVKNHDPILALDGGSDGLQAYNEIFLRLDTVLNDDGMALFEIGFDQGEKILRLSKKYGIRIGSVHRDLAGNPRVVDIFKNKK